MSSTSKTTALTPQTFFAEFSKEGVLHNLELDIKNGQLVLVEKGTVKEPRLFRESRTAKKMQDIAQKLQELTIASVESGDAATIDSVQIRQNLAMAQVSLLSKTKKTPASIKDRFVTIFSTFNQFTDAYAASTGNAIATKIEALRKSWSFSLSYYLQKESFAIYEKRSYISLVEQELASDPENTILKEIKERLEGELEVLSGRDAEEIIAEPSEIKMKTFKNEKQYRKENSARIMNDLTGSSNAFWDKVERMKKPWLTRTAHRIVAIFFRKKADALEEPTAPSKVKSGPEDKPLFVEGPKTLPRRPSIKPPLGPVKSAPCALPGLFADSAPSGIFD